MKAYPRCSLGPQCCHCSPGAAKVGWADRTLHGFRGLPRRRRQEPFLLRKKKPGLSIFPEPVPYQAAALTQCCHPVDRREVPATTGSTQASTSWVSRSSSPEWVPADSEVLGLKALPRGAGEDLEEPAPHGAPWLAFSTGAAPGRVGLALKRLKSLFTYTICS